MITVREGYDELFFLNALFMFINNPEVRDINYQIALGLLENGHELDYLTINELAEIWFVSTSSLNRFFRIYGYKKYMIFKALFSSYLRIRYVQIQNGMKKIMRCFIRYSLVFLNQKTMKDS